MVDEKHGLDTDEVRAELLDLATFLAAAAFVNVDEAIGYGPLRLLQGAQRTARILSRLGLHAEHLEGFIMDMERNSVRISRDRELARQKSDQCIRLLADLRDGEPANRPHV